MYTENALLQQRLRALATSLHQLRCRSQLVPKITSCAVAQHATMHALRSRKVLLCQDDRRCPCGLPTQLC